MSYDALASSLTLAGSVLSCVGSAGIIICFIVYRSTQRSFRHALVFNLAASDFINSLTNTISGSIYIANRTLTPGAACTFNGWIGQLSVQATDFSILAISIATLLVVTRHTRLDTIPTPKRVLLCLTIWLMPLVSSTTVAALGEMKPTSGNWCWISKDRPDLRYGLAHGWRFVIILSTICIYLYTYQYLSRHFRSLVMPSAFTTPTSRQERWPEPRLHHSAGAHDTALQRLEAQRQHAHVHALSKGAYYQEATEPSSTTSSTGHSPSKRQYASDAVEAEIKRMLLLNGYPIMYIVLWIPGLANRALEASGRPSSSKVLAALQCSTQFVGFANAVTYGLNREMRGVLGRDWGRLVGGRAEDKFVLGEYSR